MGRPSCLFCVCSLPLRDASFLLPFVNPRPAPPLLPILRLMTIQVPGIAALKNPTASNLSPRAARGPLLPIDNLQRKPPAKLHSCGTQYGSHRLRRASFSSDDFAQILRMRPQFQNGNLRAFQYSNLHVFRMVRQCSCNVFNECLYGASSRSCPADAGDTRGRGLLPGRVRGLGSRIGLLDSTIPASQSGEVGKPASGEPLHQSTLRNARATLFMNRPHTSQPPHDRISAHSTNSQEQS